MEKSEPVQGDGVENIENTERGAFARVDARLDEIKGMNIGDMSDEDAEQLLAERKALRAQKEEMMSAAVAEATTEGQERVDAEKMAIETARMEAEAAAQAEKAKQIEERKQVEAAQIEALTAEIKGGSVEKGVNEADAINAMVEAARAYRDGGSVDRSGYDAVWKNIQDASKKAPGFSDKVSSAMNIDKEREAQTQTSEKAVSEVPVEASTQETSAIKGKNEPAVESAPVFDEARAKKLLLTNELTDMHLPPGENFRLANPEHRAEYNRMVEAGVEKKKIIEELYSKIESGRIDPSEKAVLLEYVAKEAGDFENGLFQVPEKYRNDPDIKAATLRGMRDDNRNRRFVESW